MISPEDIKSQALKWWKNFLQSHIAGESFFPKVIERIGKVKSGQVTSRFEALQQELELLFRHSKNHAGTGYLVQTAPQNFRRSGSHELPDCIIFETADDYISFIGRKKEWKLFLQNYAHVEKAVPHLKEWAVANCLWLAESKINWPDILKVCQYFISTPRPNLYLRQLPIEIHTKFIEDNSALIQSLLNFLIPDHIRSIHQRDFAERYFLKYDEPLIRIRLLDPAQQVAGKLSDISIPLSDFEHMDLLSENILITENKMNFLTLPSLVSTTAVWSGGGFSISYLKNVASLLNKKIFYWGDIDEYGLQILHQLRAYFAHAASVMMDRNTYDLFKVFAVDGSRNRSEQLHLLTEEESDLYQYLKSLDHKNRLEQEKLPQVYIDDCLKNKITGFNAI